MSRVMKGLCELIKITLNAPHCITRRQMVERFNRTLMLKKVMEADGSNWDELLPSLMFSVREVP